MHSWRRNIPVITPNIINMIDVMLIIIVLLLTAASFGGLDLTGLSVNLPGAQTARPLRASPFVVEVRPGGILSVDGTVVTPQRMKEMAAAAIKKNANTTLAIYAEKTVTYEQLVRVIDQLHQAGAESVALAAQLLSESDAQ